MFATSQSVIEHPAGEEVQWDWDELGTCPWEPTTDVSLLVGALSHSSKARGWLSHSEDQPHLVEGIDEVLRRLGGTPKVWRVDRMATVINPQTGKIQASFTPVAKHYGVTVTPCPPRRGNRKGVVEKCTLCDHRVVRGELPYCVEACPANARIFGDLNDPNREVNSILSKFNSWRLKEDQGTEPKVFYVREFNQGSYESTKGSV